MANLNDLFATPTRYDHPKLRSWLSYKNSANTGRYYVEFRREREGLVFKPARIYFTAERNDGTEYSDCEPWDEDLNTALVAHQFKARDEENESQRFGYMLLAAMQPLVNKFHDGFFNAVLIRYLKQNCYTQIPAIADMLAKVQTYEPHLGQSADDCQERMDHVLARCVGQLGQLGYANEPGQHILAAAIAYYLDDRFSITNRGMLGW